MVANLSSSISRRFEFSTLIDVLRDRAIHQPDQEAYCFLTDGELQGVRLSYGELDQQVRVVAATLQSLHLRSERALLIYPPGLDFVAAFLGCLDAGVVAVPIYPPRRNLLQVQTVAADAQISAVLTTQSLLPDLYAALPTVQHWLTTDAISIQQASDWQPVVLNPDALAFLQYTSGSTGQPKGVMVSHANLLHNSEVIYQKFGHLPRSRGVIWLPPYHDMGLIGGILQPLYGGFPVTLMAPVAFLQKPVRWLQAISDHRATTSGAPNFAYEHCIEKITAHQKAGLDLSSWEVAFTGAEPIRADTLTRFANAFADCGFRPEAFYPCYGLAEATLFVTGGNKATVPQQICLSATALQHNRVEPIDSEASLTFVSCGQPIDQQVVIINPETQTQCAPNQIGEIWVAGSSIAQGYWNQPELSAQTFIKHAQATYLRTGDLGFMYENELYVTGRIKDILIIRGQNYYPQDIERTVEQSHPALSHGCGAAFTVEIEGTEQLVVVQEVKRENWRSVDTGVVITAIRAAISQEYQLQVHAVQLLKPGVIPKTSSGKVKRYACRNEFKNGSLPVFEQFQSEVNQNVINLINLSVDDKKSEKSTSANNPGNNKSERLIHWLRDYATHHINSRLIDERRCIPPSIVLDFGNQGLLGMQVGAEYGGIELSHTDTMRVLEQLGAIDPTLALFVGLNNVLGIRPIVQSGTSALQEQLLPLLATGRELAAFALTEAVAGSNPQAITSQAIPNGGGWRLNGTKIWSGSAAWAGVINVFVQHQQDRHCGISGFVLRRGSPGLRQGAEALTMGMRGMVQNTLYLDNAPVTAEQLLGEPGSGMLVAQDAMMYGRLAIAAASVGGMKRCAQLILRYSTRRTIATGRLLDHPVVLMRLNRLNAAIVATETLVSQISRRLDAGEVIPVEAYTACKTAAPEFYWQAADLLVQTLGGRGYIETNLAPQILRDARVLRIFEGPTETLNAFLGSRITHQGQFLEQWLNQTLNTPEISKRLFDAAAQIRDCGHHHFCFDDSLSIERWISLKIGELTTIAILWACLENAYRSTPTENLVSSLNWTRLQFERNLEQALELSPDEAIVCDAEDTKNWTKRYCETIGDIEQNSAGEDQALDDLLRLPTSHQSTPDRKPAESPQVLPLSNSNLGKENQSEAIQTWMVQWLSQKLKMLPEQIDRRQSFADYGIDSVIAVELAQDLETWLNLSQPLEATIAWNFPSIESLAAYLSQQTTSVPDASASSGEHLSETEWAELLAAEIAAAKGRSRR
jgi:acyl-CoA synthetase (AMP-forming)/AMP-acid ligase II/alkylation response protein AidB-like acyl-CoA dehydrogenase/acyl carrier protein